MASNAEQTGCLGQGFEHQDTGHDRATWKMPHKEWLIESDVFYRQDSCIALKLNNSINQ